MTLVVKEAVSRRERKKAEIRVRIIERAIRLFSRHGIANVTVDQIAGAVDIGKGTIYNYFQTKEDIVVAFMVDVERRVQARLQRFRHSKKALHSVLTDFLLLQFLYKEPHREFVRVLLGHMFLHTEQFLPYMVEMQKVVDPTLEALFRGLQKRGAIRSDLSLPNVIMAFKTVHLGLTALWAVEGPPFRGTEKVVRQEMMLFSQGLEWRNDH
jgi:AcrR family transcriptional regulator